MEAKQVADKEAAIVISDLYSCEHNKIDGNLIPILKDISLTIDKGDVVGIGSFDKQSILIFLEIIGNMRPYYQGFTRLTALGTKAKKKEILEYLYYIDSTAMLFDEMKVLEQLLFAMRRDKKEDSVKKQRALLDLLVELGLRNYVVKQIYQLSRPIRMVVNLLVACFSDSPTIIANILDYEFSQEEAEIFSAVVAYIKSCGKTLVFGTTQPKLIGMAADKALFLCNGSVEYYGSVDELCRQWDRVMCLIKGDNLEVIAAVIEKNMPYYKCIIEDETLFVRNHNQADWNINKLYQVLNDNKITPTFIKANKGRVENSFRELMIKYNM